MLSYPEIGDLIDRCGSVFTAILLAAKRARKMNENEGDLLDSYEGSKDVSKALEEIVENRLLPEVKR